MDSKKKVDLEDSDEYQAVKNFYEDEGYVILSFEEDEELKKASRKMPV